MDRSIVNDPATFATAFEQALNAGDLERLLQLYDPQASMRTSEGTVGQGVDLISRELRNLIGAKARIENHIRQVLQHHEVALILVDWTLEINTPDGRRVTTQGTATNVLGHTADHGWRMIISNSQGTA